MFELSLVFPMIAMVLLTFVVLVSLFRARVRSVRDGHTPVSYFKTFQGSVESEISAKRARNLANLFEAPVLFYVVCVAAIAARLTDTAFLVLAWCYVVARVAHTLEHVGRNSVRWRLRIFFTGWVILLAMWVYLGVRVAMQG